MSENYATFKFKVKNYNIKITFECIDDGWHIKSFYKSIFRSEEYIFSFGKSEDLMSLFRDLSWRSELINIEIYKNNNLYHSNIIIPKESFYCCDYEGFWEDELREESDIDFSEYHSIVTLKSILDLTKRTIHITTILPDYIKKEFSEIENLAYDIFYNESGPIRKILLRIAKPMKIIRIYDTYERASAYSEYYE